MSLYFLYAALTLAVLQDQPLPPAHYSDGFSDRYSVIVDGPLFFEPDVPLEPEVVVRSPTGEGTARIIRTDGAKVPYEDNISHVTIEHKFGETLYLRSAGFRTITITWIGERFVYINKGIGHIVSTEEIYDLVENKWLVQHTVSYRWP